MPKKPTKANDLDDTDDMEVVLQISADSKDQKKKKLRVLLKRRRAKYVVGTHGSAKFQRKSLNTDGDRHESEHVIGYNVYAQSYDRSQGEGKKIEMQGLAYLEVKALHRDHPGTGSGKEADEYRDLQRSVLDEGVSNQNNNNNKVCDKTLSTAIQINQLEYAQRRVNGKQEADESEQLLAEVSYEAMVRNGPSVTYYHGSGQNSFQLSQVERAECILAYEVRRTGKWPTQDRISEVLKLCGLDPIVQKDSRTGNSIYL
jgi:hypothetical protein